MSNAPITLGELQAAINEPAWTRIPRAAWVQRLTEGAAPALDLKTLCELATECSPAGTLATIQDLIAGLMLRHADDDATTSALMAIAHYHLPNLLDEVRDDS
jgi:hypothetical protein